MTTIFFSILLVLSSFAVAQQIQDSPFLIGADNGVSGETAVISTAAPNQLATNLTFKNNGLTSVTISNVMVWSGGSFANLTDGTSFAVPAGGEVGIAIAQTPVKISSVEFNVEGAGVSLQLYGTDHTGPVPNTFQLENK